ncbi:MAG: hypothetical protein KAY24_17300 [Candidatus Eisenbacteria sp.]|nr:hypothetical protein [Candidatus Eisenbacteria bacterium]
MRGTRFLAALWVGALLAGLLAGVAPDAQALNIDDIIRLKLAGVGEETILRVVEDEGAVFYLSVENILDLKDVGSSDEFIRALMDTRNETGDSPQKETSYNYESYEFFDDDDYATVFIHHYYDPFAYHWYVYPRFYVYYSPFWWTNCGFYFGGHWCWDWWDPWGPPSYYCYGHYGYAHYCGPSQTGVYTYNPKRQLARATARRYSRERTIYRRAGLATAPTAPQARASNRSRNAQLARSATRAHHPSKSQRAAYRSPTARRDTQGAHERTVSRNPSSTKSSHPQGRNLSRNRQSRASSRTRTAAPTYQRGSSRRTSHQKAARGSANGTTAPRSSGRSQAARNVR